LERAREWYQVFFRALPQPGTLHRLATSAVERHIAEDVTAAVTAMDVALHRATTTWNDLVLALHTVRPLAQAAAHLTVENTVVSAADNGRLEQFFWDGLVRFGPVNVRDVVRQEYQNIAANVSIQLVGLSYDPQLHHFYAFLCPPGAADHPPVMPSFVNTFAITAAGSTRSIAGPTDIAQHIAETHNRPIVVLIGLDTASAIRQRFSA
jgi:hypothetical protein